MFNNYKKIAVPCVFVCICNEQFTVSQILSPTPVISTFENNAWVFGDNYQADSYFLYEEQMPHIRKTIVIDKDAICPK